MEEESTKISEKKVLSCQKCKDQKENESTKKKIDPNITVQQKPVPMLDSMQLNQPEFNTTSAEWEELTEDELLEADRKFALRCNAVSTEKTLTSPAQGLLPIDEQRGDCEAFVADQANIELQPENETRTEFSNSIRKSDGWLQACDVSKDNVKVIEEQGEQRDVTSVEVSETKTKIRPTPDETLNEELTQRQQMLVTAMANFFRQQNQINAQQEIPHQENAHSSNESEEMQLHKREIVIPGELESNRVQKTVENVTKGHLECIDEEFAKIQGPEGDKTASFIETKANSKMEYKTTVLARVYDNEPECPQPSKGYVTLRRPKSDNATVRIQKSKEYISGLPLRADCAIVGPQKTKDYVSLIPREQDLIAHSTKTKDNGTGFSEETGNATAKPETTKDYVTFLPREEPTVTLRHSETKDYVTFQRPKSDTVATLAPFSKDYVTFNRSKSHDAEVDHQKAKDYVTVRPRELDNATTRLRKDCDIFIPQSEEDYTFVPSSQLEDYVVMIPAKKKATNVTASDADRPTPEPPTHIFWPVRRFQKPSLDPETPKQVVVLAGSSQGAELVLEPEEHHEPRRIQQLYGDGETIALIPFAEDFENAVEINTTNIPRNRILRTLLPCLPTEIPGFVQRIREHPVLRAFFMQNITFYFGFLWGIIMSAGLYFLIAFLLNGYHTGHSNVASSLHDLKVNLSIPMNAIRHNHQNQLLDSKINIPVTGVDNSKLYSKVGAVNTPVVNLDFETTTLEHNLNVFTTSTANLSTGTTLLVNDWKFSTSIADLDTETTLSVNDLNINVNASWMNLDHNVMILD